MKSSMQLILELFDAMKYYDCVFNMLCYNCTCNTARAGCEYPGRKQ